MSNYFGTGADGDVVIDGTYYIPSTRDGDVVVKNYKNLTINEGAVLTTSNRCRGLVVYVKGSCTINGKLTMHRRGCWANPDDTAVAAYTPVPPSDGNPVGPNGIVMVREALGGTESGASEVNGCGSQLVAAEVRQTTLAGNGIKFISKKVGGAGGAETPYGGFAPNRYPGNPGQSTTNGTGGGGSGGSGSTCNHGAFKGWAGMPGTCFSGGSGGSANYAGYSHEPYPYGGRGGTSERRNDTLGWGWGGAGNNETSETDECFGGGGTGGFLALIVNGDLTIGENATIDSCGSAPLSRLYTHNGTYYGPGRGCSGSGGGAIFIAYGGQLLYKNVDTSVVSVSGGGHGESEYVGCDEGANYSYPAMGANGGDGTLQINQVSPNMASDWVEGNSDCLTINSSEDVAIAKIAVRIPYSRAFPTNGQRIFVGTSGEPERFGYFDTMNKDTVALCGEWAVFHYNTGFFAKQYDYFDKSEMPLCIVASTSGVELLAYTSFQLSVFYDEVKYE